MTPVIRYYTRLIIFCYHRLDNLFLEEAGLVGITCGQWEAMVAMELDTPPRNFSEGDAYHLTQFRRDQLQLLRVHWIIPEQIVVCFHRREDDDC